VSEGKGKGGGLPLHLGTPDPAVDEGRGGRKTREELGLGRPGIFSAVTQSRLADDNIVESVHRITVKTVGSA